jgi:hypothetical protein
VCGSLAREIWGWLGSDFGEAGLREGGEEWFLRLVPQSVFDAGSCISISQNLRAFALIPGR